jgi:hypothetical protein
MHDRSPSLRPSEAPTVAIEHDFCAHVSTT